MTYFARILHKLITIFVFAGSIMFASSGAVSSSIAALPSGASQGDMRIVVITGTNTHFAPGVTTISFGNGITVGQFVVNGPTELQAPITVSQNAPPSRNPITITTNSEVVTGSFVISAAQRAITLLNRILARPEQRTSASNCKARQRHG